MAPRPPKKPLKVLTTRLKRSRDLFLLRVGPHISPPPLDLFVSDVNKDSRDRWSSMNMTHHAHFGGPITESDVIRGQSLMISISAADPSLSASPPPVGSGRIFASLTPTAVWWSLTKVPLCPPGHTLTSARGGGSTEKMKFQRGSSLNSFA